MRLAAFDERIHLAVVAGHVTDRFWWLYERPARLRAINLIQAVPGMADVVDDRALLALIHPRHLAIEGGAREGTTERARPVVEDVRQLYVKTGHEDRFASLLGTGGHESHFDLVWPFLQRLFQPAGPDGP